MLAYKYIVESLNKTNMTHLDYVYGDWTLNGSKGAEEAYEGLTYNLEELVTKLRIQKTSRNIG